MHPSLNPTLWRTCRMLSGTTRIRFLRRLHDEPGQNVAALAQSLGLSLPYASQELRRIQSRGLLESIHQGSSLIYRFRADPQVHTAQPLLMAIQKALSTLPPNRDQDMALIASGLSHERRIAIASILIGTPATAAELFAKAPMSACSQHLHFQKLLGSGFMIRRQNQYQFHTPPHPLGKALVRLLQQGICK